MPYLRIETNQALGPEQCRTLAKTASDAVAQALGKPEQYMMVSVVPGRTMTFAGTGEAAAFVELNSIGLPAARTTELSGLICDLLRSTAGIAKDRIYIIFTDVPRQSWGWNGKTF
jgi:phenylpyruvate tautomerase